MDISGRGTIINFTNLWIQFLDASGSSFSFTESNQIYAFEFFFIISLI